MALQYIVQRVVFRRFLIIYLRGGVHTHANVQKERLIPFEELIR